MKKLYELDIIAEAISWTKANKKVVLATVISTWGSSPFEVGTKMIINEDGNFLGSVSGGCVEANVIEESLKLLKNKYLFKKLEFDVSDENAWDLGLACGGSLSVYIEKLIDENRNT
tara:strand:- start:88 stop:435 length:348 start_codon:yes stop_codon:yes gene_type:complete